MKNLNNWFAWTAILCVMFAVAHYFVWQPTTVVGNMGDPDGDQWVWIHSKGWKRECRCTVGYSGFRFNQDTMRCFECGTPWKLMTEDHDEFDEMVKGHFSTSNHNWMRTEIR